MVKKIVILILIMILPASASLSWDLNLGFGGKRNVILIIPDGCSIAMWASIRAVTVGIDSMLNVDRLPVQSRCRTFSANAMVTDSGAAATAIACGVKVRNNVIGMNAATVRGDSLTGKPVANILEMAKKAGYATGIVTTSSVQHATPAAFYAHRADRNWYDLISNDIVRAGIDVIMGGGREYLIPQGTSGEEGKPSERNDARNIIGELKTQGYIHVSDKTGFDNIDPEKTEKLLGIFNAGHMNYEYDRMHDIKGEPALWEMTEKALQILSGKKKGFFLMVEAARIDNAAHDHDTVRFLWDGIACDKVVGVAREFAQKHKNTLLIVVSDHGCGGPQLVGLYETAGGDSTVISYDKAGFPRYRLTANGFPIDDSGKPIALQWVEWGGHTGEDVGIHTMGPGSEKLCGLVQNTDIFTVMANHLRIGNSGEKVKDLSEIIDY